MRNWKGTPLLLLVLALLIGTGCATRSTAPLEHTVETRADGTEIDKVTFEPLAKVGFGGDIGEAKQDMTLTITDPDGSTYELASGQNATGLSNRAQAEMVGLMFTSMMEALPSMVDAALGTMLGIAQVDAVKPQRMSNQQFMLQLLQSLQGTVVVEPIDADLSP